VFVIGFDDDGFVCCFILGVDWFGCLLAWCFGEYFEDVVVVFFEGVGVGFGFGFFVGEL